MVHERVKNVSHKVFSSPFRIAEGDANRFVRNLSQRRMNWTDKSREYPSDARCSLAMSFSSRDHSAPAAVRHIIPELAQNLSGAMSRCKRYDKVHTWRQPPRFEQHRAADA
jgi:hypothetical protein